MRKYFLLIGSIVYYSICFAQNDSTGVESGYIPAEKTYNFKSGSTIIPVKTFQYGDEKKLIFINLHADENTSVEAAKMVLEKKGGLLIKIENNNERLICFELNKKKYLFDPNRMFTWTGLLATLKKNNTSFTNSSVKQVQKFAAFVLKKIPKNTSALIALHNNDEDNFSINSYAAGGEFEKDVAGINVSKDHDPDNFFLTTDKNIFSQLSTNGYNVVLQDNKKAKDDGSLSIYYGRRNKSYVNVEAELGQVNKQAEMIEQLIHFLFPFTKVRKEK